MTVPAVTSVAPNNGSLAGGQAITITGTALDSATAVYFGANLATITTNSATQIVATSPAGTVGTVDVTVTTSGGTSPTVTADHFTYAAGVSVDPLWRSAVSYTQGYGYQTTDGTVQYDQRRSSAVLGVIVRGAPDTLSAYSGATNMGYLPSYYPTDSGLMAYRITARTFGAGNILLHAHYGPKQLDGIITGEGHISLPWWTDTTGALLPTTAYGNAGVRQKHIAITTFRIRYRLYRTNAPTDYSSQYNTINPGTVTLGYPIPIYAGTIITSWSLAPLQTCAADTLLFVRRKPQQVRAGNTSIWVVDYVYEYRNEPNVETLGGMGSLTGWWQQYGPSTSGGDPTGGLMYPESNFTSLPGVATGIPSI